MNMASQDRPGSTTHSMRPYADHLESIYGDRQRWLIKFLREGYARRMMVNNEPYIDIHILDNVDGRFSCESFRPYRVDEVDPGFIDALENRPSDSTTRLILFQCGQLGNTNSAYLDAVGWKFQLHPMFFCAHLQSAINLTEDAQTWGRTTLPLTLPSEANWLSVVAGSGSFMTAHVTGDTVVVLGVDHYGHNMTDFRNELMDDSLFPRTRVMAAASTPCDFLLPYIRLSLRHFVRSAHDHGYISLFLLLDKEPNTYKWEANQVNYRNLLKSRSSFVKYFEKQHRGMMWGKPHLRAILADYESLIQETRENTGQLESILRNQTSRQAFEETQKSVDQADAVRRITIVGIVFIPLSFASSVFGMNIEQLGSGTINLGYFFLVAMLSSILAIILAVNVKPIEGFWAGARNRHGEREYNGMKGDYSSVTKLEILWGWIRRKSSIASRIHDAWQYEAGGLMEESMEENDICPQVQIPHYKLRVTYRFFVTCLRKVIKYLNIFSLLNVRTSEQRPFAEAPDPQEPSSGGTK